MSGNDFGKGLGLPPDIQFLERSPHLHGNTSDLHAEAWTRANCLLNFTNRIPARKCVVANSSINLRNWDSVKKQSEKTIMSKLHSRLSDYKRLHLLGAARFKSKTKNLLFVTLLFGVGFGVLARPDVPAVTEAMRARAIISAGDSARIYAVLAKARRGEPICVAAIGGSITAGGKQTKDPKRRYVQQLAKWFEDTFPGLKVRFVNAGIGSTSSNYGALRLKHDVLDQHPDLVVVEYAVNDTAPPPSLGDSYEGVLRQLLSSSKDLAVIELFFMHKDGKSARAVQEELGRHYGLPMISFREAMWSEFQSGRLKWEDFYADVVHPNDEGHDITSELLRGFLASSLANLPSSGRPLPEVANLPAPLITNTYDRCVLFRAEDLILLCYDFCCNFAKIEYDGVVGCG